MEPLKSADLGAVTTNTAATTPTDYLIADWATAGLRRPSAFRTFLVTLPQREVLAVIGHLSSSDWKAVQECAQGYRCMSVANSILPPIDLEIC